MKYCIECGSEVTANAKFCSSCGVSIYSKDTATVVNAQKNSPHHEQYYTYKGLTYQTTRTSGLAISAFVISLVVSGIIALLFPYGFSAFSGFSLFMLPFWIYIGVTLILGGSSIAFSIVSFYLIDKRHQKGERFAVAGIIISILTVLVHVAFIWNGLLFYFRWR